MKRTELKKTMVYKVRDARDPNGADYVYKGISNFHTIAGALECVMALMDKHGKSRDEYIIVEVQRVEYLITAR